MAGSQTALCACSVFLAAVFLSGGGAVSEKIPGAASGSVSCGILPDAFALAGCAGTVYVPDYGDDSRHIAMPDDGYAG